MDLVKLARQEAIKHSKKKKNNNFNRIQTQEEKKLLNLAKTINTELQSMEPDTYQVAVSFIKEEATFFFAQTSRYDINKKQELQKIRDKPLDIFKNNFINKTNKTGNDNDSDGFSDTKNRVKIELNYKNLTNIFNNDGMLNIIDFLENLQKDIIKNNFNSKQEKEEEMSIPECFQTLNLDRSEIPTKDQLTKAYRKQAIIYHPDKHPDEYDKYDALFKTVNKAHKILSEYYKYD